MALDCYLGTDLDSDRVYVVEQLVNGEFDEEKMMLGFPTLDDARAAYLAAMPPEFLGGIREISIYDLEDYRVSEETKADSLHSDSFSQGYLDALRLDAPKSQRPGKNCKIGFPCGDSCISKAKSCRKVLPGQFATAAEWVRSQRPKPTPPAPTQPAPPPPAETPTAQTPTRLPENHVVSSDARITRESLDAALDQLGQASEGGAERVAMFRQFIAQQGIQSAWNDKSSKTKNRLEAMMSGLEDSPRIMSTVERAKQLLEKVRTEAPQHVKYYEKEVATLKQRILRRRLSSKRAVGFTFEDSRYVVTMTDSKVSPKTFSTPAADIKAFSRSFFNFAEEGPQLFSASTTARYSESPDRMNMKVLTTYLHEMGHQIHYVAGMPSRPQSVRQNGKTLTEYSRTNEKEFFAEHFAAWMLDANRYKQIDPMGARYIEESVALALSKPRRIP